MLPVSKGKKNGALCGVYKAVREGWVNQTQEICMLFGPINEETYIHRCVWAR